MDAGGRRPIGHRDRPQAYVEGTHARPHEPDLLPAGPDHLLIAPPRRQAAGNGSYRLVSGFPYWLHSARKGTA